MASGATTLYETIGLARPMASEAKKRRLDEGEDWRENECLKFLDNVHDKFVAEQSVPKKKVSKKEPTKSLDTAKYSAGKASSSSYTSDMRARPVFWDPSGSVWAGVRTAIVGDSMLRGKEMKKLFGSWAQVYVHEDREALAQKPPDDCERVFYVSAGNALYRHPVMFADSAFKNIRTEEFLKKVGGVILLGSVELWDRLYAPTQSSGRTVNPSYFDDVTKLLEEHNVPVRQLSDDFINNLKYTTDVHPAPGQTRNDLAKHIEKHFVEMSQSAAHEKGIDKKWMSEYHNACVNEKPAGAVKTGCKWCRKGECWDHQKSGGQASAASASAWMNALYSQMEAWDNWGNDEP